MGGSSPLLVNLLVIVITSWLSSDVIILPLTKRYKVSVLTPSNILSTIALYSESLILPFKWRSEISSKISDQRPPISIAFGFTRARSVSSVTPL